MEVSESEAQEQIQRLVQNDLFRYSELQRRLLAYLAEKSLRGEADQLKEYTIAIDALGKPESYDPRRDSAVRLQSGKLRQKIREYYLAAGSSDPVLVDFPKGHFKLVFSHRDVSAPPEPASNGSRPRRIRLAFWLMLTLMLASVCAYLGNRVFHLEQAQRASAATAAWPPATEEFWGPFLGSKDLTLVCVGTPLFVRLNSGFFRDSEVNSWDTAESLDLKRELKRAFPGETPEPWYFYTGVGEAAGAFAIGNLLTARGFHLNFTDSSQVTWNEIGQHSVVFVGPPKFVSQIEELPVTRDLIIDRLGIRNLKPKPGEPAFLADTYTDSQHHDSLSYGLISRLPGLHGKGVILVLGSTWTEGTLAASQYVTLENHLRELVAHVRLPSGRLPPYFQVVVSATVKRRTPVEISYVFHHVLQVGDDRDR
jgi:hypothetical protein